MRPTCYVIAGPNGVGKSTAAYMYKKIVEWHHGQPVNTNGPVGYVDQRSPGLIRRFEKKSSKPTST